jgi:hypothetical protein
MPDKLEITWKQPIVTHFRNHTGICLQALRKKKHEKPVVVVYISP